MKKVLLSILLFFSIYNVVNAIPIPALAIGYEIFLLIIPSVIGLFSVCFLYFKRHVFSINICLFLVSIMLYYIHLFITKQYILFSLEHLFYIFLISILFIFIIKFSKLNNLNYFLLLVLISLNLFLVSLDYDLFKYNKISLCIREKMYSNIEIKDILQKDNYLVVYGYDTETGEDAYTVVGKGEGVSHCEKLGEYRICNGGNEFLSIGLSKLAYECID